VTDIFSAGKVETGEFLFNLYRGLLCRGLRGGRTRGRGFAPIGSGATLGIATSVRVNLFLAETGKIFRNGIVGVEANLLGVGANESLVEDASGELVEVFIFDCLQHARADLGDIGNVIKREFLALASLAKLVAEAAHDPFGIMIGQLSRGCYGTRGQGRGN